jgi:hypothetical protein
MKMRILVIGISVRAMAESAVHSGYSILALDTFGDEDLRTLAESRSLHRDSHGRYSPEALLEISRQLEFDALAYTSNLENHPEILRRIAGKRQIIGNSPQAIRAVRHWTALFPRLRHVGFSVPETVSGYENRRPDRARRWLVKPVRSGGGHAVHFLLGEKSPGARTIVQEYIPGKSCSASFAANGNECVVLGITEQLVGLSQFGARGFRYCGNLLPLAELCNPETSAFVLDQVRRLAAFLTREYGLTGLNGMDFILKGDRVYLAEVNPRYSASMELIEWAYGLPMFHMHLEAALNGKLPKFELEAVLKKGRFFGKAILFAERDLIAPDTRPWRTRDIRDVPACGEKLHSRGPICSIFASGPTRDETFAELVGRSAIIKEEIYA